MLEGLKVMEGLAEIAVMFPPLVFFLLLFVRKELKDGMKEIKEANRDQEVRLQRVERKVVAIEQELTDGFNPSNGG